MKSKKELTIERMYEALDALEKKEGGCIQITTSNKSSINGTRSLL